MAGKPLLGILTIYLNDNKAIDERSVYRKMTIAGQKQGLDVIVFTPDDVDEKNGRIYAMVYDPGKQAWGRRWTRFPQLIYDRARIQKNERYERFVAFRRKYAHLIFLSRPLRNKWTIYHMLSSVPEFKGHLPATRLYESPSDAYDLLRKYGTVYIKPINGTGGRGILRIERLSGGMLLIQGRDHSRNIISPRRIRRESLPAVLQSWHRRGSRYIVQQGLQIKLPDGRVHDYRMLVQKTGSGEWEVTGCAGRVGPRHSVTSNLHGGGTAAPMETLLRQWASDEEEIAEIRNEAERFGLEVAKRLESTYGTLCELALDLAIDRDGRIWLLEVNHKPAREVFNQAGEREVYRRAVTRPIEYALWKYRQSRSGKRRSGISSGTK
ncbi:YheC/YheD family protein [Cohnella caldifontis]|uniref:YheC/YheD family endospore coat-associated protein n=1 Tax=Cohnella caldifontis TaxID=3027471 RepID=UPI0023EC7A26|nr:YheC/YheD family protein [Cohnella sp. YIM B05605]